MKGRDKRKRAKMKRERLRKLEAQRVIHGVPGADQFKQWNDAASTPIEDIRAAQQMLREVARFEIKVVDNITFDFGPGPLLRTKTGRFLIRAKSA